ncbi:hypothetical protein GCM10020295_13050 [Streptomyces cinereospinus]
MPTRVVSMPSAEWFEEQPRAYRERVLPPSVKARVAVGAGVGLTWYRFVGDTGRLVSLEHLGASADAATLFAEFGLTAEHVVAAPGNRWPPRVVDPIARKKMITVTRASATAGALKRLSDEGVSIWLDDLSRERITSGGLAELVRTRHVVGVTTNPSVFRDAIGSGEGYEEQLADLAVRGVTVDEAVRMMTTADVRAAADVLRPVYDATGGRDGRVSIEVDPRLAHDTRATVAEARQLAWLVDRPNVMIKIPATGAGLPAVTEVIGAGISVNVTLIFSLERYREVMDAYLGGLERAQAAGIDLAASTPWRPSSSPGWTARSTSG